MFKLIRNYTRLCFVWSAHKDCPLSGPAYAALVDLDKRLLVAKLESSKVPWFWVVVMWTYLIYYVAHQSAKGFLGLKSDFDAFVDA